VFIWVASVVILVLLGKCAMAREHHSRHHKHHHHSRLLAGAYAMELVPTHLRSPRRAAGDALLELMFTDSFADRWPH
jgi:hypothetical protein